MAIPLLNSTLTTEGPPTSREILIATIAFIVVYVVAVFAKTALFGPLRSLPGPWHTRFTSVWLTCKSLTGQRVFYVHQLHQKYGDVVRLGPDSADISDLEGFRNIHRIGGDFVKTNWYKLLTRGMEDNLFAMRNVQEHSTRRRLLARPFSKLSLREHFEGIVSERAKKVVAKIKDSAQHGTCDVFNWWTLMATDVIAQVAFGEVHGLVESGKKTQYIEDLDDVAQAQGMQAEGHTLYWIMSLFFRKMFARFSDAMRRVNQYGADAALRARAGELHNHNVLSGLLKAYEEENARVTDFGLGSQSSAFIIAGSGTTAVTLTYAVWAIISNPSIRSRLEKEVSELPENYNDAELEVLPYLNAVILEVLRLYGAAPGALPRVTPKKGLKVNEYYIAEGMTVSTQAYSMHRDPRIFPNPETFDPDRFLEGLQGDQKAAFSPFGAGTRVCLGIHLANMELRHALAEFFRECQEVTLAPTTTDESMEMVNHFLIFPKSRHCDLIWKQKA